MKELENEQEIRKLHVTIVNQGFHSLISFGNVKRQTAREAVGMIRRQDDMFSEDGKKRVLCVLLRYEIPMWDFDAEAGDPPSEWCEEEKAYPTLLAAADGLAKDQNVFEE